jgi:RNA polymerase sigma-70 factor (ECF subfamily)
MNWRLFDRSCTETETISERQERGALPKRNMRPGRSRCLIESVPYGTMVRRTTTWRHSFVSGDTSSTQTRPSLLLRIRDACDAEAWQTFVTIYAPLVYQYALRRGLQHADAADLTQDVMVEVARAIRSFEYQPERGRFRHWLLTVTRRLLLRFNERRARRPDRACESAELETLEDDQADVDWDGAFNARVLRVAMQRIQPSFEPFTWRAFECVWLENHSAAEAAEKLSLRIEQVYIAKSRVLKRLSEEVHEIVEDFSWLDAFEAL